MNSLPDIDTWEWGPWRLDLDERGPMKPPPIVGPIHPDLVLNRLADLHAKYPETSTDQLLFAQAALAIQAAVEALGPQWRCWVDVFSDFPKSATVHLRVGNQAGSRRLFADGCRIEALEELLFDIIHEGEPKRPVRDEPALRALWATFARYAPEAMRALFPERSATPLPLP